MSYTCTFYPASRFSGADPDESVHVYEGTAQIEELDIIFDCLAGHNVIKGGYEIVGYIDESVCSLSINGLPDLSFENESVEASLAEELYEKLGECASDHENMVTLADTSEDTERVVH